MFMIKLRKIALIATLVASVYKLKAMEDPNQNLKLHTAISAIQNARNDYTRLLENENLAELIQAKDEEGNTPLHLAAQQDEVGILDDLLFFLTSEDKAAKLNTLNNAGRSVLNTAAFKGSEKVVDYPVKLLKERNLPIDLESKDINGMNPLFNAAAVSPAIVLSLLGAGAKSDTKNNNVGPAEIAAENDFFELADILLRAPSAPWSPNVDQGELDKVLEFAEKRKAKLTEDLINATKSRNTLNTMNVSAEIKALESTIKELEGHKAT